MFARLFSRISSIIAKIDSITSSALQALQKLYDRLNSKLDQVLYKLDNLTRNLLRKYYRSLEYLEQLFRVLRRLAHVLFPIVLLFVPPFLGFSAAYFLYEFRVTDSVTFTVIDSVILCFMCFILLLMLLTAFRATEKITTVGTDIARAPLPLTTELEGFSFGRRIVGALLALIFLAGSAYLSIGFFLGLIAFAAEVGVMYALKALYGAPGDQLTPATK